MKGIVTCFYLPAIVMLLTTDASGKAQTIEPDEKTIVEETQKQLKDNADFGNMMDGLFPVLDINDDKYLSENEIAQFAEGGDIYADKQEQKQNIMNIFYNSDTDKDNRLSQSEAKKFFADWQELVLREKFRTMDRNNDGVFTDDDIPPAEESMAKLDEAMKKLKETNEMMQKAAPDEMAKNMLHNVALAQADENFYQMDKDKDGCVSSHDYAAYNSGQQQNSNIEAKYRLSYKDYKELYEEIAKKNPQCLTKEEYIADYLRFDQFEDLSVADLPTLTEGKMPLEE